MAPGDHEFDTPAVVYNMDWENLLFNEFFIVIMIMLMENLFVL